MKEKDFQQINELNQRVCVRIAPSEIHGVGLFAMRDLPKNTKLFLDHFHKLYDLPFERFAKLRYEVAELITERWPQVVHGSKFIYPDTRLLAYCNHSDDPNYDPALDITIKDIKKGEEITEDYHQIPGWKTAFSWLDTKK